MDTADNLREKKENSVPYGLSRLNADDFEQLQDELLHDVGCEPETRYKGLHSVRCSNYFLVHFVVINPMIVLAERY